MERARNETGNRLAPAGTNSLMTWKESLDLHLCNLHYTVDHLDPTEVEGILEMMRACPGLLVFGGIGQNLPLAQKAASTYGSLALRATAVDPVGALHGNLGSFRNTDLLILLTKSGETAELLDLAEHWAGTCRAPMVSIHSNRGCSVERMSERSVFLPTALEADHLNLAPTASSTSLLSFVQSLGVQISRENELTYEDFVATHPGGSIGKGRRVGR